MDLRPELLPPSVPLARVEQLGREIDRVETLLCGADRVAAEEAVAAFAEATGHDCPAASFLGCAGSRTREEFALEAARPAYPRVPDVTRDELVEVVRRILAADTDAEYHLRLFTANVTRPAASDLIFHPPSDLANASAEQIVDAAPAHRPIALRGNEDLRNCLAARPGWR
ncbi:hypothetical protein [Streptomyces sp. NBC_00343]|uniref:hypothetical protein n=1 Tax=Streptomyces sp. NBC_00343 TaxID=2975719 RepID=UPI002E2825A0|nr:hypothetical protein [Streptomyces sp. NBC_00343]